MRRWSAIEVIPAIDVMQGRVVRLVGGDPKQMISYDNLGSPLSFARRWEAEGANIMHVIDLDAALGQRDNSEIIYDIVESIEVPLQVGGGIRSLKKARELLEMGVDRVILGSLAFEEPSYVEALLKDFGRRRMVVALDHLARTVMINGWKTSTDITVDDAIRYFSEMGVELFLVTSVKRDGAKSGPDLETMKRLHSSGVDLIAAGGISSLDDINALKDMGIHGVVVGRALYDGSFTLREALRIGK